MKKLILLGLYLLLISFAPIFKKKLTIYMIGDSTMANKPVEDNPERGWGQLFPLFFDERVIIDNHAMNGRSTRSFLTENRWQPIVDRLKKGDYVIIQFGHNDESKEKKDRYTTPDDYKKNLIKFITETRNKKANPILCTSIMRRKFNDNGKLIDTHGEYPDIVRQISKDFNVPLIDMQRKSEKLINRFGSEGSKRIFLWVGPGLYKTLPEGKQDNTHFTEFGARKMAELAVEGFKELNLELVKYLKPDIDKDYLNPWNPDNSNNTYKNPVIYSDYSDPDVIRVDENFYMVSSSFNCVPALPVLHSKDLIHWKIVGNVFTHLIPKEIFNKPQHGNGVWAPSIRYHNNEFYIFYGDPDFGIYMTKSKDPKGPWSAPHLVKEGKGLIDPCPLWDDDGNAYLIHACAGSRAGIKSILTVNKMSPDGTKLLDDRVLIFDGHEKHPTIEGPKIYKKDGFYYIFAPAGGVKTGWQLVLRSKDIYGPYEEKIVLHQGNSSINGPHQGAWLETKSGESWFIHFQDKEAFGRIIHLQPLKWINGWPQIGIDYNGDGIGEPVLSYSKPDCGKLLPLCLPQTSDEFNSNELGLQWQWHANPDLFWAFHAGNQGFLRLNAIALPENYHNFWDVPNILLQKFAAPEFMATVKLNFHPMSEGDKVGLIIMGTDYSYLSIINKKGKLTINQTICLNADNQGIEEEQVCDSINKKSIYLRVDVNREAFCNFSYSFDGELFKQTGIPFKAKPGKWIGAKVGLFCVRNCKTNDSGYTDIDWFRIE